MIHLVNQLHHHLKKIISGIISRWRNYYYRLLGVRINGYVWLKKIEIPRNHADIQLNPNCALDRGVTLICSGESLTEPKIIIGANTYINRNTLIDAIALVKIGCDCAIGPNCYLTDHDHGLNPKFPPLLQSMVHSNTKIGDRVWIGANVTILKGVNIGDDAVIGAGSVVTKNIPQAAIAVGVPAKVIKWKKLSEVVC
jgi:acetyltransferase-like isoleucine patch superfamily enzyme